MLKKMCCHLKVFFFLSYIVPQSFPKLDAVFAIVFKCHPCDYVSCSIPQLDSLHNSFLILHKSCVYQQPVFWELRKCNYMLWYLTSLTHLLISSCQLLALYSPSSPAPGTLCVGGVLAHYWGGASCAWAGCTSPFCFYITACVFRHWNC